MFKKILIANRGEIAVRVIQSCRQLGIKAVAIFSEPDKDSRHVLLSDEQWRLEGPPNKVYLDAAQIIDIAKRAGVDAVHPGYGFLAENAEFAQACLDAGIKFIGPKPDVIRSMGSKVEARRVMEKAKVPVVPGTIDPVTELAKVKELGTKYGYPIAIKASAGGGGRGLRVVRREEDAESAFAGAQREGASYFGSGEVYVEKYLDLPRHIEVQVIGDEHGNVCHLFERDCSSQRRHQKLLEETPAANLDPKVKAELLEAAVRGTKALGYTSAGTLEFMVADNKFYFLEVNTRIQVEHPITEMTTGIDIVKEQIMVAQGEKLSFTQDEVRQHGHSIEFRINAEDAYKNFMPNPGTITRYVEPQLPWVRTDSACYTGYQVLPFYDSLLAKLVVWGRTREEAIDRGKVALKELKIEGIPTTTPFHLALLEDPLYLAGKLDTTYIERDLLKRFVQNKPAAPADAAKAAEVKSGNNGHAAGTADPSKSEIVREPSRQFEVEVNQRVFKVSVAELRSSDSPPIASAPARKAAAPARPAPEKKAAKAALSGSGIIKASMNGLVKELLVTEGTMVEQGQKLIIFEAMKMESDVVADRSGKILKINVKAGETVPSEHVLLQVGDPS